MFEVNIMDYKTIKIDKKEDGICILTLHRPEALNAINFQLIEDFNAVMDWLSREFDVRVVIITGFATVDMAREAMKEGAVDFIAKPFKMSQLRQLLLNIGDQISARSPDGSDR